MVSNYDPSRVEQVACPACSAQPGERCKSKVGKPRKKNEFHSMRKAVVYPEFADGRQGVAGGRADRVTLAIESYVDVRIKDAIDTYVHGKIHFHVQELAQARQNLRKAIKDIV